MFWEPYSFYANLDQTQTDVDPYLDQDSQLDLGIKLTNFPNKKWFLVLKKGTLKYFNTNFIACSLIYYLLALFLHVEHIINPDPTRGILTFLSKSNKI
jgi:hypothetical protein